VSLPACLLCLPALPACLLHADQLFFFAEHPLTSVYAAGTARTLRPVRKLPHLRALHTFFMAPVAACPALCSVEDPERVVGALRAQLAEAGLETNVVFSAGVDLDILPSRASKGKALSFLMQQVGGWGGVGQWGNGRSAVSVVVRCLDGSRRLVAEHPLSVCLQCGVAQFC
jgi:hypothetical protein